MMNANEMHERASLYALNPSDAAMEAAIESVMPLCELIARRFSGRGVEYEDLKQVALMAAVAAIQGFDPERGLKFTTYVTPTITGKVRNYLRDKGELMRTPRGVKEQMSTLLSAREKFVYEYHREPSAKELAEKLDWPVERVLDVLSAIDSNKMSSLSSADEDGLDLESRLSSVEAGYEQVEQKEDLKNAMNKLTAEEKQLLYLRYTQGLSQREAARQLNLSQMQVSRAERRILLLLRKEMESSV
ncbi:MAG: sigma-70 family RNA polymerase sigma factor [Clostridia bacterium]|nr:sigma-70 family RNA polymerase sigma factor [Clostridia bacterium]